ncbi:MAG: SIS domain-containing protein [Chloroflexota bacterium]
MPTPDGSSGLTPYLTDLSALLGEVCRLNTAPVHLAVLQAYQRDAQIFIAGNGGSAATASHLACDLSKNTHTPGRRRVRAHALTDNMATVTAWANDDGYHNIFAEQLAGVIKADDLLIAISGSGNSANVLAAVACASAAGAHTLALTGCGGGRVRSMVDYALVVPSDRMELIEDVHMAVCHALTGMLREAIATSAPGGTAGTGGTPA